MECCLVCGWTFLLVVLFAWERSPAQLSNSNPLQLSFHHVTASVADLDKEAEWYKQVLGFRESQRLRRRSDFVVVQMTIPGYRIDLVWQTPAIEAAYKRLVEQGTDVKADRDPHSAITRLVLHDPEGNEIGISPE